MTREEYDTFHNKQTFIEDDKVNAALLELATELEAEQHDDFSMHSLTECILGKVSRMLGIPAERGRIHWRPWTHAGSERFKRLYCLGFDYGHERTQQEAAAAIHRYLNGEVIWPDVPKEHIW